MRMISFGDLPEDRQLALRERFGDEMARLDNTCSLDEKIARFAAWLAPQGIRFTAADLPRRRPRGPAP